MVWIIMWLTLKVNFSFTVPTLILFDFAKKRNKISIHGGYIYECKFYFNKNLVRLRKYPKEHAFSI